MPVMRGFDAKIRAEGRFESCRKTKILVHKVQEDRENTLQLFHAPIKIKSSSFDLGMWWGLMRQLEIIDMST